VREWVVSLSLFYTFAVRSASTESHFASPVTDGTVKLRIMTALQLPSKNERVPIPVAINRRVTLLAAIDHVKHVHRKHHDHFRRFHALKDLP
jgi:hypothetical protein